MNKLTLKHPDTGHVVTAVGLDTILRLKAEGYRVVKQTVEPKKGEKAEAGK